MQKYDTIITAESLLEQPFQAVKKIKIAKTTAKIINAKIGLTPNKAPSAKPSKIECDKASPK